MKIRVALADDHRMLLDALIAVLASEPDIEVAGVAHDGSAAIRLAHEQAPDVLVLDIAMPGLNGVDVARRLRKELPAIKVLALSAYVDKRFVQEMLKAGAVGYVAKTAALTDLPRAIRTVAGGQHFLSPEITTAVVNHSDSDITPPAEPVAPPVSTLSPREREVLRLVADGVRTTEIARRLGITEATVEVHRRNVMQKLDLRSVAQLTKYAVREGLSTL
jgi:DNA-binding NarL/FixJ family response regulator